MTHLWLIWIDRVVAVVAALLLWRAVWRRHPVIGRIIAAGVIVRVVVTVALFAISNFAWPIATGLQLGDGFWRQAMDARGYYTAAQPAFSHGLGVIANTSPSSGYLRFLVIWLWTFGDSPLIGALSNVAAYLLTACVLALSIRSASTGMTIAFAAVAFSPSLIGHGSQILKDEIFVNALLLTYAALAVAVRKVGERDLRGRELLLLASGFVAVALASGTRLYVVLLLIGVIVACFGALATANRFRGLWRASAVAAGVLIGIWLAIGASFGQMQHPFEIAVGPGWRDFGLRDILSVPAAMINHARSGFDASGGQSSLVSTRAGESSVDSPSGAGSAVPCLDSGGALIARSESGTVAPCAPTAAPPRTWLSDVARGASVLFVPMTVLRVCCDVDIPVNRGLLLVADLDTVFSTIVTLTLLVVSLGQWRRGALDWRAAFIPAVVSVALLVMIAYTVTNFGTLFRLRSMAFVPLWMLPVVGSPRIGRDSRS